jgi:hypothetical protein
MIRAAPRDHQRTRQYLAVFVQDVESRFRHEHRPRMLHEGDYRDLAVLPVRLAQPPDYAAGGGVADLPSTPAFLRSERTVSVGVAPFSSQARACSAFTSITAGLAFGL